jgi:HEAT repeat protein
VQTDETADVQEILEAATHDPEPLIRELAYQHLYAQGDTRLSDRLLEDARSADSDRRKTALQFLSQTSASDALPILAEATEDPNIDIQFTAFQQLSSLADAGGLSVIRERLHHPTSEIRLMAIEAMAAHGRAYALEAARATLHDADELVRSKAEGVMHELNSHAEEK